MFDVCTLVIVFRSSAAAAVQPHLYLQWPGPSSPASWESSRVGDRRCVEIIIQNEGWGRYFENVSKIRYRYMKGLYLLYLEIIQIHFHSIKMPENVSKIR